MRPIGLGAPAEVAYTAGAGRLVQDRHELPGRPLVPASNAPHTGVAERTIEALDVPTDIDDADPAQHQRPPVQCTGHFPDHNRGAPDAIEELEHRHEVRAARRGERPQPIGRRPVELNRDLWPPRPVFDGQAHREVKAAGARCRLDLVERGVAIAPLPASDRRLPAAETLSELTLGEACAPPRHRDVVAATHTITVSGELVLRGVRYRANYITNYRMQFCSSARLRPRQHWGFAGAVCSTTRPLRG